MVLHYSAFYYSTNSGANQNTFSTYSHFIRRKDKKKCRRLSYGRLSPDRGQASNLIDYSGSRRINEKAMEKGMEKGVEQEKRNSERKEREAALEMLKDGLSFEQIARYMKLSVEAVADIARENKLI